MKIALQFLLIMVVIGVCILSLTAALHSVLSGGVVIGLVSAAIAITAGVCAAQIIDWYLN